MKWIGMSLICCLAVGAMAKEEIVQSGTPAVIEAANGKKARVFLQQFTNGRLSFQPYQSTRNMTVPVEAVRSLEFYPQYDADALQQQFLSADYTGALTVLKSLLEPYVEYMSIDNNLRELYSMLMEAYFRTGDYSNAKKAAEVLIATGDTALLQRGQVHLALMAIEMGDLETADKIREEISGEAAKLYVQACIERAENRTVDAFKTVSNVLLFHANDFEWMGRSELLSAELYVDYMAKNPVVETNSPLFTARQAKNIYRGSSVSAEAEKLWASLGGEKVQAAIDAEKAEERRKEAEIEAERKAAQEEMQARREAEAEARRAERRAAREAEQRAEQPDTDAAGGGSAEDAE